MKLNENEYKLLQYLLQQSEPVSLNTLTYVLYVSEKTIRTMIAHIMDFQKELSFDIELQRTSGYVIHMENNDLKKEFEHIVNESDDEYIMKILRLFLNKTYVSSNEIEEKLFISRSVVTRIQQKLRKVLKTYELSLESKSHYGFYLKGDEKNIRKVLNHYYHAKIMSLKELKLVEEVIDKQLMSYEVRVPRFSITSIAEHVLIMKKRIKHDYVIEQEVDHSKLKPIAWKIAKGILREYYDEINDGEVLYLYFHIEGKCLDNNKENLDLIELLEIFYEEAFLKYGIDFSKDKELMKALEAHIRILLKRIKNDVQMRNPIMDVIINNYQFAYEICCDLVNTISKKMKCKIIKDEIAFLSVHIGLSLERARHTLHPVFDKIAIVCTTGEASARLLEFKIRDVFLSSTMRTFPMFDVKAIEEFQPSLILSTVQLDYPNIPVKVINPIFFDSDRQSVVSLAQQHHGEQILNKYFDRTLFIADLTGNQEEVITKLSNLMKQRVKIPDNFIDLCMERERIASTCMGSFVALAHPMELCSDTTKVAVGLMKKPISWGEHEVRVVFLIAQAKGNETRDLMFFLQDFVFNLNLVMKLQNVKTYEKFQSVVLHYIGNQSK